MAQVTVGGRGHRGALLFAQELRASFSNQQALLRALES